MQGLYVLPQVELEVIDVQVRIAHTAADVQVQVRIAHMAAVVQVCVVHTAAVLLWKWKHD